MKYLMIWLIELYQYVVSPILSSIFGIQQKCRYSVCCSAYAKQRVKEKGFFIGGYLALRRFLSCQPFGTIRE